MNWDRIEGAWRHYKGNFKRRWPRLTNVDVVKGEREHLAVHIEDRYEISKDEAENQLADWQGRQSESDRPA